MIEYFQHLLNDPWSTLGVVAAQVRQVKQMYRAVVKTHPRLPTHTIPMSTWEALNRKRIGC